VLFDEQALADTMKVAKTAVRAYADRPRVIITDPKIVTRHDPKPPPQSPRPASPRMKRFAAAAESNREPIREALQELLPASGSVLEIASGSGQHAVFFAGAFQHLSWQPSDRDPDAVASIAAYHAEARLPNLAAPVVLDVEREPWPITRADTVLSINMIHIAPWSACLGLIAGSARLLEPGAPLILYGPFRFDGQFTAPSNAAFDQRLRGEDPAWGVRELRDVERAAQERGLRLEHVVPRPANNHVIVFRRFATTD
jgi:hypothetical protein